MSLFVPTISMPAVCEKSDSWTCAIVYETTGNKSWSQIAAWLIGRPIAIVGLIIGALVIRWIGFRLIDQFVKRASSPDSRFGQLPGSHKGRRAQRALGVGSLLKSLTTVVVFGIVFVMILAQLGVNIAPILASASVLGLAIGFGAQSLVKDYLSGIAMMIEDQYGVGDSVDLGGAIGTVEAIGLRVTRIRDVDGTVWYVRNGEILRVGNQSQNWARTVLDITVAPEANIDQVQQILRRVAHELAAEPGFAEVIIEEPEVWGVQSLSPDGVVVRVTLKTAPLEQWRVAREMRGRIKAAFDAEGIAFPQRFMPREPIT